MIYRFGVGRLPAPYPVAPRSVGHPGLLTPTHATIVATAVFQAPGLSSDNFNLAIKGSANLSWVGSQRLYIKGRNTNTTMSLFVATDDAPTAVFSCPLAIKSLPTGVTGMQGTAYLVIKGNRDSTTTTMNMFVEGAEKGFPTDMMNMAIFGGNFKMSGSIPLLIVDNIQRDDNSLDMFIKAPGMFAGFTPINTTMNMYVERGPTGGITLFIGRDTPNLQAPLFITGKPMSSESADLYVKGDGGIYTTTTTLAMPNVIGATQVTGQIVLVIPDAIGDPSKIANLYVGGWM